MNRRNLLRSLLGCVGAAFAAPLIAQRNTDLEDDCERAHRAIEKMHLAIKNLRKHNRSFEDVLRLRQMGDISRKQLFRFLDATPDRRKMAVHMFSDWT